MTCLFYKKSLQGLDRVSSLENDFCEFLPLPHSYPKVQNNARTLVKKSGICKISVLFKYP